MGKDDTYFIQQTAQRPDIGFKVIAVFMYSFWGHIVWSSHCKENEQMRSYHPRKRRRNPHCTEMWLSWRMRVSRNSSLEKSGTRLWKEIMPSKAYSHLEPKIQPHEHLMTAEHCWKHLLYFRTLKKAFLPPEPPLRLPWAEPPWNDSSLVHSAAQEAVRYTSWVYSATTRSQDSTPLSIRCHTCTSSTTAQLEMMRCPC